MARRALSALGLLSILGVAPTTRAQVMEATSSSFQVKLIVQIAAPPDKTFRSLVAIGSWWDAEHTYSGSAKNLSIEAKAGGCFCETLPNGGGVQHMTVVNVVPNQRLVMRGALGPLQSAGVDGAMTWSLAAKSGGTELTLIYNVGGYYPGGLLKIAGGVDTVLGQQVDRLRRFVETGAPAAPPPK